MLWLYLGCFLIVIVYFIFCTVIIRCYTACFRQLIFKASLNSFLSCDHIVTHYSLICGMHQVFSFLAYIQFNLFRIHLIHRGCDPSDMELVNTEIRLQISYMM